MKYKLTKNSEISKLPSGTPGLILVEGYDMVGKSEFLRSQEFYDMIGTDDVSIYRPDYEQLFSETPDSDNRYLLGLAYLDALDQQLTQLLRKGKGPGLVGTTSLVFDRSFLSSLVYTDDGLIRDRIMDGYSKVLHRLSVIHQVPIKVILLTHDSKMVDSARLVYDTAVSTRDMSSEYRVFDSFEEYYGEYLKMTSSYLCKYYEVREEWKASQLYSDIDMEFAVVESVVDELSDRSKSISYRSYMEDWSRVMVSISLGNSEKYDRPVTSRVTPSNTRDNKEKLDEDIV